MGWPDLTKPNTYVQSDIQLDYLCLTREQVEWMMANPPNLLFGTPIMANDNTGRALKVGDRVNIPCVVTAVHPMLVSLETEVGNTNGHTRSINIDGSQVLYVGPGVDPAVEAKLAKIRGETPAETPLPQPLPERPSREHGEEGGGS